MNKLFFIIISILCMVHRYSGHAQDHQNDWFYNPWNQYSAHHRAIGNGAFYADEDHPAVQDWFKGSQINMNVGTTPWGLNFVAAEQDGPVKTVTIRECSPINPSLFPVDVRFPKNSDIMPDYPCDRDGTVGVYDRSAGTYHEFFRFTWNNGNPQAGIHRATRLDDTGHGSVLTQRIGTSASGVALAFGLLRGWEIKKEGHPIGHALQMVLPRLSTHSVMMLSREVWWPAASMDGNAYTTASHNTGNIPYGSLWAIPPVSMGGPDLDTLSLTEKGKRLAEAIRDYGIYVVDGGGAPSIRCDQDFTDAVRSELVGETRKFYKYLRMVINSVPDEGKVVFNVGDVASNPTGGPNKQILPGEFPAGGGIPLASNTAIDAVTSTKEGENPRNNLIESIRIFPNPANDIIQIVSNKLPCEQTKVDIINSLGQILVKAEQFYHPVTSIILPEGKNIYFVRITSSIESKVFKVVRL